MKYSFLFEYCNLYWKTFALSFECHFLVHGLQKAHEIRLRETEILLFDFIYLFIHSFQVCSFNFGLSGDKALFIHP